ncbi:MAG: ABC transporter permease [Turicibacter sp.]|nr:ABC transporter permease [Turicibacter sp.]
MFSLYWISFKSLVRKEINRFMRIWVQTLVPPVITTSLYFIIFGNFIGARVGEMNGFSFMQFMVPGLIMQSVIANSYSNVSSSFFSQKFQKNIEELLVAPVPTFIIMSGFLVGGMARGLLAGLFVTGVSLFFVPLAVSSWLVVFVTVLMTSLVFSLAGLLNGLFAKSFDDVSIVPTFILTPLTYLGGVFYSITLLPPVWQFISRFNPIVYMISGFRYGFLGAGDMALWTSMAVLALFIVVLFAICYRLIEKGRGLRS